MSASYKLNMRRGNSEGRGGVVASDNIWEHSAQRGDNMRLRVSVGPEYAGTKQAITRYDWQQTLCFSKQLYSRVTEISGALHQKNLYCLGDSWCPRFDGKNQEWGNEAEMWLENWFPSCNLRGEPFDFLTSLFVDSVAIDRDGDSAMATVVKNGEPKLQFFAAHQIGSRYGGWGQDSNGYGTVPDGRFKGLKAYNGVIFGKNLQVVGYNVLGVTPEDDSQLPIQSCQLLYEPEWSDQGRGIPKLATSLLHWMDYEDIHTFLKRQVKQDSAQGIMHYNESGEAEVESDFIEGRTSSDQNQDVKIEKLEGNEIMYFKAMGGGKIEPYRTDRPSPNVDAYLMRIVRGCLQSMQWFYEIYDPSKIGGASTRLIQDIARACIRAKQRIIRKRAMRAITFGLSVAMEHGEIPYNDDPDWIRWSFTLPSRITVDPRYDDQTAMDRIKMGAGTYAGYYGDKGEWWEDEIRERIKEQKFIQDECAKAGVELDKVQILLPNGDPAALAKAQQENQDGGESK